MGIDMMSGKWFEDLDWFVQNEIPIRKIIQHQGDAVITGS